MMTRTNKFVLREVKLQILQEKENCKKTSEINLQSSVLKSGIRKWITEKENLIQ